MKDWEITGYNFRKINYDKYLYETIYNMCFENTDNIKDDKDNHKEKKDKLTALMESIKVVYKEVDLTEEDEEDEEDEEEDVDNNNDYGAVCSNSIEDFLNQE